MGDKLEMAQEQCNTLKARSTKVIRLRQITDLPDHLRFDENFKIIYLVRDPRGIANSRFNIADNNWNEEADKKLKGRNIFQVATDFCCKTDLTKNKFCILI